jgi:hypothetical protein
MKIKSAATGSKFFGEQALMLKRWISSLQTAYQRYVIDYKEYLRLRDFGTHINDWFFVKRGFVECWWQPGFHRFWQAWNPGISYFTYKFYLFLGGNKRQNLATIIVFLVNGLIHNLVVIPFLKRWDFPLPFTFLCFGLLTVCFRWLDRHTNLEKLPDICHLCINVGLVILSFKFGFYVNDHVVSILFTCPVGENL